MLPGGLAGSAGAIMSYGIMWPLINSKAGDWFPAKYGQGTSNPQGLTGYKVRDMFFYMLRLPPSHGPLVPPSTLRA